MAPASTDRLGQRFSGSVSSTSGYRLNHLSFHQWRHLGVGRGWKTMVQKCIVFMCIYIYIYLCVCVCMCIYIYTVIYNVHTHTFYHLKKCLHAGLTFTRLKAKESNCYRNGHRTNDRWKNEPRDFIRWKSAFPWPVPLRLDSSSSSESVPMVSKTIGARSIDMILAFHPIHIKHHKTS